MRAITSVGPPAGKPTTTRTGRVGYPSARDAATPDSNKAAARNMRTTGAMALPQTCSCWRHHRRGREREQEQSEPAGGLYFFSIGLRIASSSSNDIEPWSLLSL